MLGKFVEFCSYWTGVMLAGIVLYGIMGLSLGAGSLGLDYFLASTRLNFGG